MRCEMTSKTNGPTSTRDNYGLLKVAASDNHVGRIKRYCGIKTAKRVRDMREMAELIRRGEVELFTEYEDAE